MSKHNQTPEDPLITEQERLQLNPVVIQRVPQTEGTPLPPPWAPQDPTTLSPIIFHGTLLPGTALTLDPETSTILLGFNLPNGDRFDFAPSTGEFHLTYTANGLVPRAVEEETHRPATQADSVELCAICQCLFEVGGEEVSVCPCVGHSGHVFHRGCLRSWFARERTCPMRCALRERVVEE